MRRPPRRLSFEATTDGLAAATPDVSVLADAHLVAERLASACRDRVDRIVLDAWLNGISDVEAARIAGVAQTTARKRRHAILARAGWGGPSA